MDTQLLVTGLGKQKVILGFPWLAQENPDINWTTSEFKWRESATRRFFRPNVQKITLERLSKLDSQNDTLTGPANSTPEPAGGDLSSIKSPKTSENEEDKQDRMQYPLIETKQILS
jgi:hypothetical protein